MNMVVFGINHKTAPVAIREKINFSSVSIQQALKQCMQQTGANEVVILSTCNRTEIYYCLEQAAQKPLIAWLCEHHRIDHASLQPFIYNHTGIEAVRHILRVASSLDSMILGEPQVLGQIKDAYKNAVAANSIGKILGHLFQYAFRVAKQIRTKTAIGKHPVSVAYATVRLTQQIFAGLAGKTALLIGVGDTIRLTARHLHENGLSHMIIANRTFEHSQHLARKYSAHAIMLENIPQHLAEADIIISSTASEKLIIDKQTFAHAIKLRKHRIMFVVDVAVPRDIDPETEQLEDIYLYTVDDLQSVIQDNLHSRQQAAAQAEEIIEDQITEFINWMNSLDTIPTIRALRDKAEDFQVEVLRIAKKELLKGTDPEATVKKAIRMLSNKLIHMPTTQLRAADITDKQELLQSTAKLFELNIQNANTALKNKQGKNEQ